MIGYFLLFQLFATIAGKPSFNLRDDILGEIVENDANLNPGFDLEAFRQGQLDLNNYYREKYGVPLMTLDSTLTQQAQSYAEKLALTGGGLVHCNSPSCDRHGAGENLAAAGGSTTAETNATKAWYDEIWDYNFCTGGTRPGHEGKAIGHFTQVVWKTSIKLGIGYARTADRTGVYVVGRYLEHANVGGQYLANVLKPSYILDTFQDNCDGTDGGLTSWSAAGQCSRSCGGGVQFKTKTCTNPKPSLNGRDCPSNEPTKEIAVQEWCNTQECSGTRSYRAEQCEARGYQDAKAHNFGGSSECILHCFNGDTYMRSGNVNDGTHCNSDSGACVAGVCEDMPDYSPSAATQAPTTTQAPAPTQAPATTQAPAPTEAPATTQAPATTEAPATGQITGEYIGIPSSTIWDNTILTIPNGATNVQITNNEYGNVKMVVGYESTHGMGYNFAEATWMDSWVAYQGYYETTHTTEGVEYTYRRDPDHSTITTAGPVQANGDYSLVLFVRGTNQGDISWSYDE